MMYIPRYPPFRLPIRHRRHVVVNQSSPYKFAYARTALKFGLQTLGALPNREILVPEFICNVILPVFKQLDLIPVYYPINYNLEPDWESIHSKISEKTQGIVSVHYFGQPQRITEYLSFAKHYNIWLIEDNAHGFGGLIDGNEIGTFGDIGISSPRKCFPILNGAYLHIKKEMINPEILAPERILSSGIVLKQIIRMLIMRSYLHRVINIRKKYSSINYQEINLPDWGMDESSDRYLKKVNLREVVQKRQAIYHVWERWAVRQGLVPVFSQLAPGASPMVFAAYTSSYEETNKWFIWGYNQGIDIHPWPDLPKEIVQKNGAAIDMWKRLICFPIHMSINAEKLIYSLEGTGFKKVI